MYCVEVAYLGKYLGLVLASGYAQELEVFIPLGREYNPQPNLRALTGGNRLIPPNNLGVVRRFTGAPYQKLGGCLL